MAFCEECPLRGKCIGEIRNLELRNLTIKRLSTGIQFITFAALRDKKGGLSEVFYMPTDMSPEAIMTAVDECEYPNFSEKGIIRKRSVAICRPLGIYVCKDTRLNDVAKQAMIIPMPTRPAW